MSTPVLSKKQQRKSSSTKKGPVKGLRNVLAQPQQLYWPVLKLDECEELENIFKKSTSSMKCQFEQMPWSQLKKLTKEERSEIRKKERDKRKTMLNKQVMDTVVTGTNAVTRALEKNRVCSVLLDANIDPPLLVKHIVMMAQNKKMPILLVPFLRSASLESIGYTCIAFALKDAVCKSSDHHFHLLYNKIQEHSSKLLPPNNLIETFNKGEKKQEIESNISIPSKDFSTNMEKKEDKSKKTKDFVLSTNVYKYRTSVKERVFVPSNTKPDNNDIVGGCNDFINLGVSSYEIEKNSKAIPKNRRYINIHDTENKTSDEGTDLDHSEQTNFIPIKDSGSDSDTSLLKLDTDNEMETETCVSKCDGKKRKMSNVTYKSLKIKRVQGNNNRSKATKMLKKKKAV